MMKYHIQLEFEKEQAEKVNEQNSEMRSQMNAM